MLKMFALVLVQIYKYSHNTKYLMFLNFFFIRSLFVCPLKLKHKLFCNAKKHTIVWVT